MGSIDPGLRCVDSKVVPTLKKKGYLHTQYVDNFVAFSQCARQAHDLAVEVGRALNERGLPTHPVESGHGMETLGWCFAEGHPFVGITNKRLWKLRLATLELLRQGRGSGRIERLVGHFTFAGLLQRGMLSVFQASYVYIRKHYEEKAVLWPEVRRELTWAASLLCLMRKDLGAEWSSRVHATDASMWGRGVVATERNLEDIRNLGKRNDMMAIQGR